MLSTSLDFETLIVVLVGALVAGFTTGFAGFGTALVASGLWFQVLPPVTVPPLVALASVAGQLVGLFAVRKSFDWPRVLPYLVGGVIGVPLGVAALTSASPFFLKTSIGTFLIAYALYQLMQHRKYVIKDWGGKIADCAIGLGGGFLGGFAGLSGPLPLIWLQLRGGSIDAQRATYQPFNLIVLALASLGMVIGGQVTLAVLSAAVICLPATLISAWIGARAYVGVSPQTFRYVVLCLLLLSGCALVVQAVAP
jgi:uncharacterized membrane protein YfcA